MVRATFLIMILLLVVGGCESGLELELLDQVSLQPGSWGGSLESEQLGNLESNPAYGPPFYTGTIIPTPQEAQYEDSFAVISEDGSAAACVVVDSNVPQHEVLLEDMTAWVASREGHLEVRSLTDDDLSTFQTVIHLSICNTCLPLPQEGYLITSDSDGEQTMIRLIGQDRTGLGWACQSWRQLLRNRGEIVEQRLAQVRDWPVVNSRGFIHGGVGYPVGVGFTPDEQAVYLKFNRMLCTISHGQAWDFEQYGGFERWGDWRNLLADQAAAEATLERIRWLSEHGLRAYLNVSPTRSGGPNDMVKFAAADPQDVEALINVARLAYSAGGGVCLMFDDTTYPLRDIDLETFDTCADSHIAMFNAIDAALQPQYGEYPMIFCPPYYMSLWHLETSLLEDGDDYLRRVSAAAPEHIEFFWTGRHVTSSTIGVPETQVRNQLVGRRATIFDNVYGGPHARGHYYFDPMYFEYRFPREVLELWQSYFVAHYNALYEVALAQVADYLWNPDAYDANRSLEQAVATVAGPNMMPLLVHWRQCIEQFDPYLGNDLNPLPGAEEHLSELEVYLVALRSATEAIEDACSNPNVVEGVWVHFSQMERAVEKVREM